MASRESHDSTTFLRRSLLGNLAVAAAVLGFTLLEIVGLRRLGAA